MNQSMASSRRYVYMDFLRVLACFLVIVNHTNSDVFRMAAPGGFTWLCSVTWYYFSKIAVSLFLMVSGACLLSRVDSYRRVWQRVLRMVLTLLLFSYVYWIFSIGRNNWNWGMALEFGRFFSSIWKERITDSFWYLYFYIGLLVMLPLFQRLAKMMEKRDHEYLLGICFGVGSLWSLLVHYFPGLALPAYLAQPVFPVLVGVFFLGYYLHVYVPPGKRQPGCGILAVLVALGLSTLLTLLETKRVAPGAKYLFMDGRDAPSLTILLCAVAVFQLARWVFSKSAGSGATSQLLRHIGACSFGIYLLQDFVILETRHTVFLSLCNRMNPFFAAILWEILVFAVLLPVVWCCKKIPGLRKLL